MIEETFTKIFKNNTWGSKESVSGGGSILKNNRKLLENLDLFVQQYNIKSIVDCGCGDFNWMKHFSFDLIHIYLGLDIVKELIDNNISNYSNDKIKFKHVNLVEEQIEYADLIMCKDVLFHLSYDDAKKIIQNIKNSGSKYLMSTTFYDEVNKDIKTGGWRPINLQADPFLFNEPIIFWKNIEPYKKKWVNKSIAIWKLNSLV